MDWTELAVRLLHEYVKRNESVTCYEAFEWAYKNGLPRAASPKQLGPVFKFALRDTGMVRLVGTTRSKDPVAKGRAVSLYSSVVCQYFDGANSDQERLRDLVKRAKLREFDLATLAEKAYQLGKFGNVS